MRLGDAAAPMIPSRELVMSVESERGEAFGATSARTQVGANLRGQSDAPVDAVMLAAISDLLEGLPHAALIFSTNGRLCAATSSIRSHGGTESSTVSSSKPTPPPDERQKLSLAQRDG